MATFDQILLNSPVDSTNVFKGQGFPMTRDLTLLDLNFPTTQHLTLLYLNQNFPKVDGFLMDQLLRDEGTNLRPP